MSFSHFDILTQYTYIVSMIDDYMAVSITT